jgi:hypothetical protein
MTRTPPQPETSGSADWPAEVAGRIESAVGAVRDKTTVPITQVARVIVYGLFAGVLAAALAFLLIVAVVRICDVYLPFHPTARRVWVVYAGGSAIFLVLGAFAWSRRRPRANANQ